MMYHLTTVTLRLSDKEKKELLRYGTVSEALRQGIQLYLRTRKKQETLHRLEELQKKNPAKISSSELVKMIREDRNR